MNAWNRILAALALGAFAFGAAKAAGTSADEAAIRELKETLWPKAYFQQDTALLDRILAPEFQSVDDDGNWSTKAEEIAWVAKNKPSYESLTFAIRRLESSRMARRLRPARARSAAATRTALTSASTSPPTC